MIDPLPVDGQTLTIAVAGEHFALPAGAVAEIVRAQPWTRVPLSPTSMLGVANLRGSVLPVLSLARMLGKPDGAMPDSARIVVVQDGVAFGLLVDDVLDFGAGSDDAPLDLAALLGRDFDALLRPVAASRSVRATTAILPEAAQDELTLIGLRLAGQDYALPLDDVVEIIAMPDAVTAVPRTDQAMLGVIVRRTGLLPLVSLRVLLGLPRDGYDRAKARIVVTRLAGGLVGLVVDGTTAILRVPQSAVDKVPPVLTRGHAEAQVDAICRVDQGRRLVSALSPARLLDAETSARIQATVEQAIAPGAPIAAALDRGAAEQFVIFELGAEQYGLPIAVVDAVVRHPGVLTPIPGAPGFIEGAMNLRGKVVPVIDQMQRFGAVAGPPVRGRRVVVVTVDGLQAGFAVDSAAEVRAIPVAELAAAPAVTAGRPQMFDRIATLQPDGLMMLLVNPKSLLDAAERDVLAAAAQGARTA